MALDGVVLSHIKREIETEVIDSRVEKIYQPSKEEVVIYLRSKNVLKKLLISSRASSPRVHFINNAIENPQTPPMFCMLLRKKLLSAKFSGVRQNQLDRVLFFDFMARNEIGDVHKITLVTEIMGKHSNVILIDESGIICDALKRVNSEMSSKRLVLPGVKYELPPSQNKLFILDVSIDKIIDKIVLEQKNKSLNKAILSSIMGVSPIVCDEIEFVVKGSNQSSNSAREKLKSELYKLKSIIKDSTGTPNIILNKSSVPIDVTFFTPTQYEQSAKVKKFKSFSEMLDSFYFEKDSYDRMKAKSHGLLRNISNTCDRLQRKIESQKHELELCSRKDKFRVFADVINANLYACPKCVEFVELPNFYDQNMSTIKIQMDRTLSPSQNAQRYYKKYQKLKVAEKVLSQEIIKAEKERDYLETVLDELSRVKSELDLALIKEELIDQGYLKRQKKNNTPKIKPLDPIESVSSEGFKILIGRNNKQNDFLTLKFANKNDIWFHVKDIPGSHVILRCNGRNIGENTIRETASLAAKHSKAHYSSNVPVDYTEVKNVSKPNAAKPGMVIYVKYKTIYVTPNLNE